MTARSCQSTHRASDELWQALLDGGEVRWIDDLNVLDRIAYAYAHTRRLDEIEKRYLTPGFTRHTNAFEQVEDMLKDFRPLAHGAVQAALVAIDQHLADTP